MTSDAAYENKKRYVSEYNKKYYHRISLNTSPELYERIKAAADQAGESVNKYVLTAVISRMDN